MDVAAELRLQSAVNLVSIKEENFFPAIAISPVVEVFILYFSYSP